MGEFHAVLLEGLFFLTEEHDLLVQTTAGVQSVYTALRPLVGQQVYVTVHHVPSDPVDGSRWGGGSCFWQPARCPFGHHERPASLFNLVIQGTLYPPGDWHVGCADGSTVYLHLAAYLPGHTARIAVATAMTAEQMRETAAGVGVESLGQRVADLRDLVGDLGRLIKRN